ncbi:MAG: hypothetical protein MUF21_01120 [Gemmatimonadaceae bacterium]|jgi:hypothetical protein|nr:hypothetical protein [Gemmatimonadaceae bacterium]
MLSLLDPGLDSAMLHQATRQADAALFGFWVQVGTLVAAVFAGYFAWTAAHAAQVQAKAATDQTALLARDVAYLADEARAASRLAAIRLGRRLRLLAENALSRPTVARTLDETLTQACRGITLSGTEAQALDSFEAECVPHLPALRDEDLAAAVRALFTAFRTLIADQPARSEERRAVVASIPPAETDADNTRWQHDLAAGLAAAPHHARGMTQFLAFRRDLEIVRARLAAYDPAQPAPAPPKTRAR